MFVMPLPLGILLFMLGLFFLYRNKLGKAKLALSLSLIWIFLISYAPLVNQVLYTHESKYPTLQTAPQTVKYIYVLGGGHHTDDTRPITSQVEPSSVVRLNEGIRLYHQLKTKPKLIVSGYAGLIDPTSHAKMQQKLAIALGVNASDIHLVREVKDTQEEAIAAKEYIGEKEFILVTSASHMPRAIKFFQHEGLNPHAAPTNHLAYIKHPNYKGVFSISALHKSQVVWHEFLGQLWQKIKGI